MCLQFIAESSLNCEIQILFCFLKKKKKKLSRACGILLNHSQDNRRTWENKCVPYSNILLLCIPINQKRFQLTYSRRVIPPSKRQGYWKQGRLCSVPGKVVPLWSKEFHSLQERKWHVRFIPRKRTFSREWHILISNSCSQDNLNSCSHSLR